MAVRWLRRASVVAVVVVAVLSITTSVEAGRDERGAAIRTADSRSDQRSSIVDDPSWHVTDTGWALVSGTEGRRESPHETARALAGGMDIGAAITLGSTVILAGVLVLVVRRRRKLS